jgi:hypothetical protein
MSQEDIDRLVAERSLARQAFDDADVAGFWAKAVASYTDASRGDISADSRFLLAYTACLQATFAVLAASGLRVKSTASHYKAFYAMQKLDDPVLRPFAIRFDELRATRHQSIYEPLHDEAQVSTQLKETIGVLRKALSAIREWLSSHRPSVAAQLAQGPR